jgi:hypothetical protein
VPEHYVPQLVSLTNLRLASTAAQAQSNHPTQREPTNTKHFKMPPGKNISDLKRRTGKPLQ